jgi:hypothetical protein
MQEFKPEFIIKPYDKKDGVVLTRVEERTPKVKGLPPDISQVIFMKKSEIGDLIECLQRMK